MFLSIKKMGLHLRLVLTIYWITFTSALVINNLIVTQPLCASNTGAIDFDVTGVVGTLNIIWVPAAYTGSHLTNLPAGTYNVSVTDDLDTYVNSWTIISPAPILITNTGRSNYLARACTYTTNPAMIAGAWPAPQEAGKVGTGGTGTLTYLWSSPWGSFDDPNLQYPIFYLTGVTVPFDLNLTVSDANGCSAISTLPFVLQIMNPALNLSRSGLGLNDGSITLTIEGRVNTSTYGLSYVDGIIISGQTVETYSVSTATFPVTYSNLGQGAYTLKYDYLDGSCQSSLLFEIGGRLNVTLPPYVTPGGSFSISSDGVGPYIYSWKGLNQADPLAGLSDPTQANPGFFGTSVVTYELTLVDDLGNLGTTTTIFNPLTVNLPGSIQYCTTYQLAPQVQFGLGPYTYSWSPAGSVDNPTAATPMVTLSLGATQTLTVTVTDATGYTRMESTTLTHYLGAINGLVGAKNCNASLGSITQIDVDGVSQNCWGLTFVSTNMLIRSGTGLPIPDQFGLDPGLYDLSIGCTACAPLHASVEIPDNSIHIVTEVINYCTNPELNVTGTVGPPTYTWSTTDPSIQIITPHAVVPVIQTPVEIGSLNLVVSAGECIQSQAITFIFDAPQVQVVASNVSCGAQDDGYIIIDPTSIRSACQWADSETTNCTRTNLGQGVYAATYIDGCDMIQTSVWVLVQTDLVDSDGDGFNNCVDGCPFDPLKIEPGQCGCGYPDIDYDQDGVASCIDVCDTNCETIEACPGVTVIEGDDSQNPVQSVVIQEGSVDLTFNLVSGSGTSISTIESITINQLPLIEIDPMDSAVQSMDLNRINWTHTLIKYNGYRLLISEGSSPVHWSLETIDSDVRVNLTWYNYFFEDYCRYPFSIYGIEAIECQATPFNWTIPAFETRVPGDNKLSYTIMGWPFLKTAHRLQAQIIYNTTGVVIKSAAKTDYLDREIIKYDTTRNLDIAVTFLKVAIGDGSPADVELVSELNGTIKVIFGAFNQSLKYDPVLAFLFYGLSDSKTGWAQYEGPLIAVGIAVGIGLLIVGVTYNKHGHIILLGRESYRVMKLRKHTAEMSHQLQDGNMVSHESATPEEDLEDNWSIVVSTELDSDRSQGSD